MNFRKIILFFFYTIFISANLFSQVDSLFKKALFKTKANDSLYFRYYAPNDANNKRYPLILFFHGVGECGSDNIKQLKVGLPDIFKQTQIAYPCCILAPQCPRYQKWVNVKFDTLRQAQYANPEKSMELVLLLLDQIMLEQNIDTNRIYIMGLSMGGFATWDIITRYPNKFAAAVPVCGGGDESQAYKITQLPLWAFHGAKDPLVKVVRSQNMIAAIRKAGGKPHYTEYSDVGHGCWNKAFSNAELYKWLFSQTRKTEK